MAGKVHAAEVERRGLATDEPEHGEAGDFVDGSEQRWVSAGIFRFEDEIRALLPALRRAEIRSEIETDEDDLIWMGTTNYRANRLLVPEAELEEARRVIESFAHAEELAAREEAAAPPRMVLTHFEDGVFKPVEPVLGLAEGTEVEVELPRE